jgi:hypothetical protein
MIAVETAAAAIEVQIGPGACEGIESLNGCD